MDIDLAERDTDVDGPPPRRSILFLVANAVDARALQNGLGEMQPKWTLHFVDDAVEALAAARTGIDAAVIDLQAPGLDGEGLFRAIMKEAPGALRLGVSLAGTRQSLEGAGAPVHQFLPSPCDPKVLNAVLSRAFASQDFLPHEPFRNLVASIHSLPALPGVYNELMQELKSAEPSLERAGEIVAKDPGLSANILKLVNSAFFGIGHTIAHPSEAAMFLGIESLKALVLSLQVFSQFQQVQFKEFTVEQLWKHSWTTGVLARRLCVFEEAGRATTDEAFIAGLLHDVGKLILAGNHPEQYHELLRQAHLKKVALWQVEFQTLHASHAELGGYLLGRWGLPAGVVEAVGFHHRPAQAPRQDFCALTAVHVANTLGKLGQAESALIAQPVDLDYLRALGLGGRVEGWKQFFTETLEKKG